MSRKTKLTSKVIENVYTLKRECRSNLEVCHVLGISESTLYDWLDKNSPRFNSEFSESYSKGVKESRTHLKDLAVCALSRSLRGATLEQVWYNSDGDVIKRSTRTTAPNVELALNILHSFDSKNFPKQGELPPPEPLPKIDFDEDTFRKVMEEFNKEY